MEKLGTKIEEEAFLLGVDTTTPSGSIALLKGTSLLAEVNQDSPTTFSERLLPAIRFLLESNGLKIQDVGGFAVAVGPGSFTGIRIGLSTVKSFAYSSGRPVAPVSTLMALARKIQHPKNRLICPLLDAKKTKSMPPSSRQKQGASESLSRKVLTLRMPFFLDCRLIGSFTSSGVARVSTVRFFFSISKIKRDFPKGLLSSLMRWD